jgi:flagellin-like protein
MKKIWKIRKDSEAVSPVIATILMVAITVVLAAVLYVMVMGFGGSSTQTPTGAFTSATKLSSTTEKILFGTISPDTKFVDCKLVVDTPYAAATTRNMADGVASWTDSGSANMTVSYTDMGADGKISVGDYVTITASAGLASGDWIVTLLYTSTGGSICAKTFTV